MGLSVSQIRLLTLTSRKANIERDMLNLSMEKLALTRQMREINRDYGRKLNSKRIGYYEDGAFKQVNYAYLMGTGNYVDVMRGNTQRTNGSMVLTDYNGLVVLSDEYANVLTQVFGNSIMDSNGVGRTFSMEEMPKILCALCQNSGFTEEDFRNGVQESSHAGHTITTADMIDTGSSTSINTTNALNEQLQALIDYYYSIFQAAAVNGWTTAYNNQMNSNPSYLNDALTSGLFQLCEVSDYGHYEPGKDTNYFITCGCVESRTTAEDIKILENEQAELQADIKEKESYIDILMTDKSTELEATKTELESVKSFIKDAISSVFQWGNG